MSGDLGNILIERTVLAEVTMEAFESYTVKNVYKRSIGDYLLLN